MSKATKQKILAVSRELFYETGIASVRLQQIAEAAGISVGHLAYHYKNKEAIVTAVYKEVFHDTAVILKNEVRINSLKDLDIHFEEMFDFVNKHQFCFNNLWEISRNYPALQRKWDDFSKKKQQRTLKRLNFLVKEGILKEELFKEAFRLLAQHLFFMYQFWARQQVLQGKPATLLRFKNAMWYLIYPYLAAKGLEEYNHLIASR